MGFRDVAASFRMMRIGFGFMSTESAEAYPGDLVVPVDVFSDNFPIRNQFMRLVLRFDHVLSPTRLRETYEQLITQHGWRKMGARLRSVRPPLN